MIHNIREAFTEILEDSDWMDDATKAVAKEKVSVIVSTDSYLCHDAESSLSSYQQHTFCLARLEKQLLLYTLFGFFLHT